MRNRALFLILAAAASIAPASAARPDSNGPLQKVLAGRNADKPVSCINLGVADESQVIDGKAIVYRVGQTVYVNRPQGAEQLRRDDVLVATTTVGTQLCRLEAVRLLDRAGQFQRGIVTLGDFIPYTKPRSDK